GPRPSEVRARSSVPTLPSPLVGEVRRGPCREAPTPNPSPTRGRGFAPRFRWTASSPYAAADAEVAFALRRLSSALCAARRGGGACGIGAIGQPDIEHRMFERIEAWTLGEHPARENA